MLCMIVLACKSSKKGIEIAPTEETVEKNIEKKILFDFIDAPLLSDALAVAKKENKWIYMDIGAKWCTPCQLMKSDVYTNKEIATFFNQNFIPYLIDGEKNEGPDLRLIFEVKSYPTLLFIDENGRAMMKIESGLGATALMELGQSALAKKNGKK